MHVQRSLWILATSLLWAVACTSSGSDAPGSSRFVVLGEAVVRDTRTGLEWTRRDDGEGLDWPGADAYCRTLTLDDAGGWRLPGIEELRGLYGATRHACGDAMCAIDPAFTLTSPWVWSATPQGSTARAYLDFRFGTQLSPMITPRLVRRVLCVRASVSGAAKQRHARGYGPTRVAPGERHESTLPLRSRARASRRMRHRAVPVEDRSARAGPFNRPWP